VRVTYIRLIGPSDPVSRRGVVWYTVSQPRSPNGGACQSGAVGTVWRSGKRRTTGGPHPISARKCQLTPALSKKRKKHYHRVPGVPGK
jgi:hypothetical protein